MDTIPLGVSPAKPDVHLPNVSRPAPIVPAGPNSLAIAASRRGLLGAMIAMPAMGVAGRALAAPLPTDWRAIVLEYYQGKAEWEPLNAALEEHSQACVRLQPPRPKSPDLVRPVRQDMTIEEIKAIPLDRDYAEYEADLAEWDRQCAALQEKTGGPLKAATEAAWARYIKALDAVTAYPAPTLSVLREKIDILAAEYDCGEDHIDRIYADIRRLAREG